MVRIPNYESAAMILELDTIFEINNDKFSAKYSGSYLIIDFW